MSTNYQTTEYSRRTGIDTAAVASKSILLPSNSLTGRGPKFYVTPGVLASLRKVWYSLSR